MGCRILIDRLSSCSACFCRPSRQCNRDNKQMIMKFKLKSIQKLNFNHHLTTYKLLCKLPYSIYSILDIKLLFKPIQKGRKTQNHDIIRATKQTHLKFSDLHFNSGDLFAILQHQALVLIFQLPRQYIKILNFFPKKLNIKQTFITLISLEFSDFVDLGLPSVFISYFPMEYQIILLLNKGIHLLNYKPFYILIILFCYVVYILISFFIIFNLYTLIGFGNLVAVIFITARRSKYNNLNQKRNLKYYLLMQVRDKEKKLKPIKQPVKPVRNLLGAVKQPTQSHMQANFKESMQRSKGTVNMVASNQVQQPKISTLENVCTNLLEAGQVQSYIDLFYISHKCMPNVMKKKNYYGQKTRIPEGATDANEENLQFYKELGENLSKAEVRPQSLLEQKQASMNEYNSMAFNYEDQGDYITACYFYNKVIDIASSCKNKQFQLVAMLGLGKCYDQQNSKDQAIELLQNAFDEACVLENAEQRTEMTKLIGKELIEIYMKKAAECERINLQVGLQAYECALRIAKKSNELDSQARISHKIGELYYQQGKFHESVSYQQNYLELLKKSLDNEYEKMNHDELGQKKDNTQEKLQLKFKQMEAYASLAKCYLKLKDIDKAETHLNSYHKMAKQAKAQNSVADSSYYLAKLFQEKGEKEKAISYYQSYFEAAKSQKPDKKDRKLVDKARVTFAIAKANKNLDRYISMLGEQDSLSKVLDWKIKRVLK